MPRFSDRLIDRIKSEVSLIRLVEAKGFDVTVSGFGQLRGGRTSSQHLPLGVKRKVHLDRNLVKSGLRSEEFSNRE